MEDINLIFKYIETGNYKRAVSTLKQYWHQAIENQDYYFLSQCVHKIERMKPDIESPDWFCELQELPFFLFLFPQSLDFSEVSDTDLKNCLLSQIRYLKKYPEMLSVIQDNDKNSFFPLLLNPEEEGVNSIVIQNVSKSIYQEIQGTTFEQYFLLALLNEFYNYDEHTNNIFSVMPWMLFLKEPSWDNFPPEEHDWLILQHQQCQNLIYSFDVFDSGLWVLSST